ncbi:stalk domain-containing protein [Lysinibacillus xylanilyticus]|uniref:stalk domain-containing protein n=1 Tax=Lysinibacillus xylanilyticus TaxID=582475 RepID=UPI00382FD62C
MFSKFKTSCMITAVALASILPGQTSALAASDNGIHIKNNVSININGETLKVSDPIVNKSDYLFLPMRALYEAVGASVDWKKETLTASAIRNGKLVDLTIGSKTALVDGQKVPMVVAPFMYKDRTYMPLRFVSENFGGNVNWNPTTQTVDISLTDETPGKPQGDPYILHINNNRIVMEDPIIVKQSRSYIPANYIYDNLEDSSGTLLPDNSFELQIAGMSFVFKENSNQVLINDEVVTMEAKPFMQNGKMYVPVSFIVNALGGNLRYIEDKRELYLYVYQYMYTSSFLEKSYGATSKPGIVPSARLEGDRDLLISDNPETLTSKLIPKSNATLAQYQVKATSATNKHRVFGWHYNTLGTDVQIGITVQNTSSTESIEVIDSKGTSQQTGNSWVGHDIGLTIADATLNDKLKKSSSKGIVIAPGETKVIESYDLLRDYIIGFLHDLDIKAVNGGTPEYTIRTVLTKNNSNLTSILSDPVPIDVSAKHPRGAWTSSTILAELPAYTVDSPEVGYNISNSSTDHFLTTENSLSQINGAIGNPGHFGMNYKVSIPLVNQTGTTKTIKLKLAGRGGIYSGAVKVNGKVYLVPTLRVGTEYVELPDYIMQGSSEKLELEFMHAGGVNLPVAIYVETK